MKIKCILSLFLIILSCSFCQAAVRYVKANATGNGSSWSNASGDLQAMMDASAIDDEVWVAGGTYVPHNASPQRYASFLFKLGVKVYGSFAGTESKLEQRTLDSAYASILSGDVLGDDGPGFSNRSDNTAYVVQLNGWDKKKFTRCHIDGFVIKGGQGSVDPFSDLNHSLPTPANGNALIFTMNGSLSYGNAGGGGMYLWGAQHFVANCAFVDNQGLNGAGAFVDYNYHNYLEFNSKNEIKHELPPLFLNCVFAGNKSSNNGGGLYYDYQITNSIATLDFLSFVADQILFFYGLSEVTEFWQVPASMLMKAATGFGDISLLELEEVMRATLHDATEINIDAIHSPSQIRNCIFSGNRTNNYGGGLYSGTAMDLTNSAFLKNRSEHKGGGLYSDAGATGELHIDFAHDEGGIWAGEGMNVSNCSFRGNTAKSYGGGVYTQGKNLFSGWDILNPYKFWSHVTPSACPSEFYFNCEFTGNKVIKHNGGGMYASLKNPQIYNCTFSSNDADQGGGLSLNRSHCALKNSIFVHNRAESNHHHQIYRPPVSTLKIYNTIVQDGFSGNGNTTALNITNTSPLLVQPVDPSSAPTIAGRYALLNSTVMGYNAGNNSYLNDVADKFETGLDFAGNKRIMNCTIDIGAQEYGTSVMPDKKGILYVNILAPNGGDGSSWAKALNKLDFTSEFACDNNNIKEIWVAKGIYHPLSSPIANDPNPKNKTILVSKASLYGGFVGNETSRSQRNSIANPTIFDGQLDVNTKVYHVITVLNASQATIDGFTIRNGSATEGNSNNPFVLPAGLGSLYPQFGGGIYILGGSMPTIFDCTIVYNTAGTLGGGIFVADNANIRLYHSDISLNSASGVDQSEGGALFIGNGSGDIVNCTFKANQAWNKGGAVLVGSNVTNRVHFTNCLFSGNSVLNPMVANGLNGGGGVFVSAYPNTPDNSNVAFTNCTFAGNKTQTYGGGLQVLGTNLRPVLRNCTVWGNKQDANLGLNGQLPAVAKLQYCLLENNVAYAGNDTMQVIYGDPLFAGPVDGNSAPTTAGDYRLLSGSPAINAGYTGYYLSPTGATSPVDIYDSARIEGCAIDIGAAEFQVPGLNLLPSDVLYPDAEGCIYVDQGVTVSGDGHNWEHAVKEMADAVRLAQFDYRVKTIKVAEGIYRPRYPAGISCSGDDARQYTFLMKGVPFNGLPVAVADTTKYGWFGGYPSGGATDNERDPDKYPVILDGFDTTNHVVTALMAGEDIDYYFSSYLDGFTIKNGKSLDNATSEIYDGIHVQDGNGAGLLLVRDQYLKSKWFYVSNCTFDNNKAFNDGGGLYLLSGMASDGSYLTSQLHIDNCSFVGNKANNNGGGMFLGKLHRVFPSYAASDIKRSRFKGNSSANGAAVYLHDAPYYYFESSLASGNRSSNNGGGFYIDSVPHLALINNTIAGNKSDNIGDALFISNCNTGEIINNVIWGNASGINAVHLATSALDISYNVIQQLNTLPTAGYNLSENIDASPMFADSIAVNLVNATPTALGNYRLASLTSPAFNTGNNFPYLDTLKDLDGLRRVSACTIDRGAFEKQVGPDKDGVLYVDSAVVTGTGTGGSWDNAMLYLADAIELMQCNALYKIKEIKVAQGTYLPKYRHNTDGTPATDNRNKTFFIGNKVKITGGYPSGGGGDTITPDPDLYPVLLSGQTDAFINAYHVVVLHADSITLEGLHIINGRANGSSNDNQSGAGIYAKGVFRDLLIANNVFAHNYALHSGGAVGFQDITSAVFTNNIFRSNESEQYASALYFGGTFNQQHRIVNSLFSGNKTSVNYLGGVVYANDTSLTSLDIVNTTFAGNALAANNTPSPVIGGYHVILRNCIIWGNSSNYVPSGTVADTNFKNCIIEGANNGSTNPEIYDSNPVFVSGVAAAQAPTINGDYNLQPASPAIDRGSNKYYLETSDNIFQVGNRDVGAHNRVIGCRIDLGSYEYEGALAAPLILPDAAGVVYVDSSITQSGTGNNWLSPIKDLADALRAANFDHNVNTILVAKGTYIPKYNEEQECATTDTHNITFYVPEGLSLIGGYAANGGGRQYISDHITTLSGWLDSNTHSYHVITMNKNAALLDGFLITGGKADGMGVDALGGGVLTINAKTRFNNLVFYQNEAVFGGGLSNGIWLTDSLTMTPEITNCLFYGNTTSEGFFNGGGAMALIKGEVRNTAFVHNKTFGTGGAVIIRGGGVHMSNSIFSGNSGTSGGAIFTDMVGNEDTAYADIVSCMITGNYATGLGGGVANNRKGFKLINCTIADNYAKNDNPNNPGLAGGGAVFNYDSIPQNEVLCVNTILWGNMADSNNVPVFNQINNNPSSGLFDHCIVQGGLGGNMLPADPGFFNPAVAMDAPTAYGNYHLSGCSPAINAGIIIPEIEADSITDLDGMPRITDDGVDLGAYEFGGYDLHSDTSGILYVDSSLYTYGDGSTWITAVNNLADALRMAAKDTSIRTIKVAKGTYYPQYNIDDAACASGNSRDRTFLIPAGITVMGGYPTYGGTDSTRNTLAYPTILSGDLGRKRNGNDNCYHVVVPMAGNTAKVCTLDGLMITHGKADGSGSVSINGSNALRDQGGGIFLNGHAKIVVKNCILSQNQAAQHGGGITSHDSARLTMINCLVDSNTAVVDGGGIFTHGINSADSTFIVNTTFTHNSATQGAALRIYAAYGSLRNVIIWDNTSGYLPNGQAFADGNGSHFDVARNIIEGGITAGVHQYANGSAAIDAADLDPRFLSATDYSLSLCSPAINAGDNIWVPQGDTTDIAGAQRIKGGVVDLGAFENDGFVLDTVPGNQVITAGECIEGDWHYFYEPVTHKLVLALNGITIDYDQVTVKGNLNAGYGSGNITPLPVSFAAPDFYYPMNRSWHIDYALTPPATPTTIRFYFNNTDSADLAAINAFQLQDLVVYKVDGNDAYPTIATGFRRYAYAATADTNHYTLGQFQGIRYAEFEVNEFSSGTLALKSPLPLFVKLLYFEARAENCRVRLLWQSAEEVNLKSIEVQNSNDGKTFHTIASLDPRGSNAHYEYQTEQGNPVSLYRLKFIDEAGFEDYSTITKVSTDCGNAIHWVIVPNPLVEEGTIILNRNNSDVVQTVIAIYDGKGSLVYSKKWDLHPGLNTFTLPFDKLSAGTYLVTLTDNQGNPIGTPQKVIKNK